MPKKHTISSDDELESSPSPVSTKKQKVSSDNLFVKLLTEGTLVFPKKGSPYSVSDPILLKQHLEKHLGSDPTKLQEFLSYLESHIQKQESFRSCLLPIEHNDNYLTQDTLIKILLGVECLQPDLIDMLLQKLSEFISDDSVGYGENIPKMILGQFRWLERLVDNTRLTNKIIETLGLCGSQVKKDLIAFIPDIVEDSGHPLIVEALKMQLTDDPQLTVPIVDCFSNLNLPPDLTGEVQDIVLDTLNSASMDDLPVLVGFLLQSVNPADAQEVVKKLRQKLEFGSVTVSEGWDAWGGSSQAGGSSSQKFINNNNNKKKSAKAGITLTLEAIKSAIRFKKELVDAFFKQIQSVESVLKHKVLDVWVLFILHTMVNQRKAVVACFRKKIIGGHFTPALLKQSLVSYSDPLREDMVVLAEGFLRSTEPPVRRFGVELYTLLFSEFQDKILRQDILGSLTTHIGASGEEINSALEVLNKLAKDKKHLYNLVPFSTFLKGILDYIDSLSDSQLRTLFSVFSALAFIKPKGSGKSSSSLAPLEPNELLFDDMHIFIRKQLMNSSMKYKRMGIIGSICIITRIGSVKIPNALELDNSDDDDAVFHGPLHEDLFEKIKGFIDLVFRNCGNSQLCVAFFYDELVNAMNSFHFNLQVVEFISDKLDDDVRSDFIIENTTECANSDQLWGNLDGGQAEIVISIYPVAVQPNNRDLLLALGPMIRLMQTCVRMLKDNTLTAIEGLLGCPLLFYPPSLIDDIDVLDNKEPVALCLFYAVNWCREVVNSFANVKDSPTRGKVVKRLEHIIELETLLETCLNAYPNFRIPHYVFWADPKKGQLLLKKKKAPKKATKKKDESPGKSAYGETPCVNIVKPYFRQLDLSALYVMTYTFLQDSEVSEASIIEIQPLVLRYLLEDLHTKISQTLVTQKKAFPAAVHSSSSSEIFPSSPFLIAFPDPRLAVIALRPIFAVLPVHLERAVDAMLALKSKRETESQSLDVEDNEKNEDKEDEQPSKQNEQLKRVWKDSIIHVLNSYEKLFSFEDLYAFENELIIRSVFHAILDGQIEIEEPGNQTNMNFLDPDNPLHSSLPLLPVLRENLFSYFDRPKFVQAIAVIDEFDIAVAYVNMLAALVKHKYVFLHSRTVEKVDLRERVSDIAGEFLKKKWKEEKLETRGVTTLLERYLISKPVYPTIPNLVAMLPAITENKDEQSEEMFGTLTKDTLPSYFVVLFTQVTSHLQVVDLGGNQTALKKIKKIQKIVELFKDLLTAAKYENVSTSIVACALRKGRLFLEAFIKRILPIFSACFKETKDSIINLFKPLQTGTRILQQMCDHGKLEGSTTLLSLAPNLRKVLEALVYKVEVLFASTDYADAFQLGNLRHKDLKGQEVSSQTTAFSLKKKKTKSPPKPKKTKSAKGTKGTKGTKATKGKKKKVEDEEDEEQEEHEEQEQEEEIEDHEEEREKEEEEEDPIDDEYASGKKEPTDDIEDDEDNEHEEKDEIEEFEAKQEESEDDDIDETMED